MDAHTNGSAAAHLGHLLHIAPRATNGNDASSLARSHSGAASQAPSGRQAPPPPPASLDPMSLDFSEAGVGSIVHLYSAMCRAGKLDDALLLMKECVRAGRSDVFSR